MDKEDNHQKGSSYKYCPDCARQLRCESLITAVGRRNKWAPEISLDKHNRFQLLELRSGKHIRPFPFVRLKGGCWYSGVNYKFEATCTCTWCTTNSPRVKPLNNPSLPLFKILSEREVDHVWMNESELQGFFSWIQFSFSFLFFFFSFPPFFLPRFVVFCFSFFHFFRFLSYLFFFFSKNLLPSTFLILFFFASEILKIGDLTEYHDFENEEELQEIINYQQKILHSVQEENEIPELKWVRKE